MNLLKKIFVSTAICTTGFAASAQIIETKIEQGIIAGEQCDGYVLYKAIPYAEAPVGELRWKQPIPKKPWGNIVYKAPDWGNCPYQHKDPNQGVTSECSEDCLFLSVQTPAKTKDEKLPVFVMIHGGGFSTGSYAGTMDSFVREGIVYVGIEYRLGALGFMAHPDLSKESKNKISGNYGLYDQILALQWIHNNISAFGGDPQKVTICGESAGGYSVSMLCASPLCKGLFCGAISESGGNFAPVAEQSYNGISNFRTCKAAETVGVDFQNTLDAKNIKAMRNIHPQIILDSTKYKTFWPVVDGNAIVGDQYALYEQGRYNDVNVLIGFNSDEGSLFCNEMTLEQYRKIGQEQFGEWANAFFDTYPAQNDQEALYAIQDMFRDRSFGWNTYAWANLQTKTGNGNVYMYYFAQQSQNSILKNTRGATHVAEMPFIYGWNWGPMTETEQQMAAVIPQYWINFIKTGNPNGKNLPYWAEYKQGEETVMNMQNGFELIKMPNQDQMNFFEFFYKNYRLNQSK